MIVHTLRIFLFLKKISKFAVELYDSYIKNDIKSNSKNFKLKYIKKSIEDALNNGNSDISKVYTYNNIDDINHLLIGFNDTLLNQMDDIKFRDKSIIDINNIFKHIEVQGDPIIQIGTVFYRYGDKLSYKKNIVVLGNEGDVCEDIKGVEVIRCTDELELLLKWKDIIIKNNPDFITGYNIFGFDFDYINVRISQLSNSPKHFYKLGKLVKNRMDVSSNYDEDYNQIDKNDIINSNYDKYKNKECKPITLYNNVDKYINMDGRVVFDLASEIKKSHALESYKLDNVSSHFMRGLIIDSFKLNGIYFYTTDNIGNLKLYDYILFDISTKYGKIKYKESKKFKIVSLSDNTRKYTPSIIKNKNISGKFWIGIEEEIDTSYYGDDFINFEWCLSKDDIFS